MTLDFIAGKRLSVPRTAAAIGALFASALALSSPSVQAAPAKPAARPPIVGDANSRGKTLPSAPSHNWLAHMVTNADGSFTVGNPEAPIKLTEYVSYTCPHCAEFHKESSGVLRLTAIPQGKIQLTVVSVLRNPVDLAASLLVSCGDPKRIWARHDDMLGTQETWLAKAKDMTPAQEQRWTTGPVPQRLRAIASDFDFYAHLDAWGITRVQADQCLSNQAGIDKIMALQTKANDINIPGTPSFTINGQLVPEHDWTSLSKDLDARLAKYRAGMS